MDESSVEVGKSQERLDVLDLSGFRPIEDGLDLGGVHGQSIGSEAETEVLNRACRPLAFFGFGIQSMFS